jgi:predicted amidophosphoribosyltransferase
LGKLYANELLEQACLVDVDAIIALPLHIKKLKARGFNQSEWYAMGLAEGLNKPIETQVLEKLVETQTQTNKKKYARWENVEGVFGVKNTAHLINKHVLLVDDVITTGATLEAAWQALKNVEGIRISVISIAFAAQKLT